MLSCRKASVKGFCKDFRIPLKIIEKNRKKAKTEGDLQKKTPKQVHLCQKCGILTMYF